MRNLILNERTALATIVCMLSFNTMAQQNDDTAKPTVIESSDEMPMDHSEMQQKEASKDDEPMDHSTMDHSAMGQESMEGKDAAEDNAPMDHSKMDHSAMGQESMEGKDATEDNAPMDPSKMDHSMSSSSNTPPANARDPHAYSDGLTLDSGAYALPGPRQLVMADEHAFWAVMFDRFEYADGLSKGIDNATQYDMQAWYGSSYDRLVVTSEGEIVGGKLEGSENQILWGHAISPFWDSQVGVRFDTSEGPSRQWLSFGLQGLAPYWFEVSASIGVGSQGRTVLDVEAEYELLITQRLVLQPRFVLSAYGKDNLENGVGKGLSSVTAGLRLRYEFSRQFAPYFGVEWTGQYGNTADFTKLEGGATRQTQWVAGIRFWFQ